MARPAFDRAGGEVGGVSGPGRPPDPGDGPGPAGAAAHPALAGAPVDPRSLRRVLLRLPNWLGDVCFAAPAVEALAAAAPDATFVAAARPSVAALAARLPRVVATLVLHHDRRVRGAVAAARLYRRARCDAAIVFPRSVRAALPVAAARVPVRVGYHGDLRGPLLTHAVRAGRQRDGHRTRWFGALLAGFGLPPPTAPWRLVPTADDLGAADAVLRGLGVGRAGAPLVALEPGGHFGTAKRWEPARYAALARALVGDGAEVVLVGTAAMAPLHAEVTAAAGVPLASAAGATSVPVLAALLARCALVVGNDTGPLHLAAAVGAPVLGLYGSTDPAVCGPRGAGPVTTLYDAVACAPCWLAACPVPGHPCLDGVDVARVVAAARAALAR